MKQILSKKVSDISLSPYYIFLNTFNQFHDE